MLLCPPLTGTQLSPVAPRSWVLPSDHTPGNRHDRRAKPVGVFGALCASLLATVPKVDKLIVLGDFNAYVATDHATGEPAIYGHCVKGTAPWLSSDDTTLLTEKSKILKRWAEHFRSVFYCSSATSDAAIDLFPRVDTNNELDLPPSLPETIWTVQQISSGKAPGSDAIPPEVYKHGGPRLMAELTTLFQEMWRQGQVPQEFKDATIVHLYKRKGNGKSVITTEASLCTTSPGRSSPVSFSIV
ncbi:unnamed protein product [Schistocephalus solidus]|uniref:Endo/exonuclease/phosphatase domain-containing protein n=1 Tax=Schistocephalus solidus TaxID=70667 RepID=A0A183SFG2_SCHSO|nr:unnamed protein product [Schistocephalus solidus]